MDRPHVEELRIQNYGCIQDATFRFTPLHALIGPNDSGKSTVLRALQTVVYARNVGAGSPDLLVRAVESSIAAGGPNFEVSAGTASSWSLRSAMTPSTIGGAPTTAGLATFKALGYPKDPVEGACAVTNGVHGIGLIGGVLEGKAAPTRLIDATCDSDCTATPLLGATLPAAMTNVVGYWYADTLSLVVGNEIGAAGMTRTFLVDLGTPGKATELLLQEPRRGAASIPVQQLGTFVVLGGEHADGTPATSIESFYPTP